MLLYYKPSQKRFERSFLPSVLSTGNAQGRDLARRSSLDLLPINALITIVLILIYAYYRINTLRAVQCPSKWVSWTYLLAELGLFGKLDLHNSHVSSH